MAVLRPRLLGPFALVSQRISGIDRGGAVVLRCAGGVGVRWVRPWQAGPCQLSDVIANNRAGAMLQN